MPTLFKIESEKYFNDIQEYLRDSFNKDYLMRLHSELKCSFPEPYSIVTPGATLTLEEFISPRKISQYRSDELTKLLSLYIMDDDGMKRYFNSLPQKFQELLRILCKQKYVSASYLSSVGLESCIQESVSRWYYSVDIQINAHDIWFDRITSYDYSTNDKYHRDTYFCIVPALWWIVEKSILPQDVRLPHFKELPEEKFTIYDAETEAFAAFPVIEGLLKQDSLIITSFRVTQASSFKAMKQLPIKEICPDMTKYSMKYNLGQVLFPYLNHAIKKKASGYPEVARKAFQCLCNYHLEENLPNLLPFVRGFRANVLRNYASFNVLRLACDELVESEGQWINIEFLSYQTILMRGSLSSGALESLHLENAFMGSDITPGELSSDIDLPLLQSFFSVLYGLGGASLACVTPDTELCNTPFEHVKYVRLNEFGKYIIGLTDSYSAPLEQKVKMFELDTEHLIIRSVNPGNPYESLLFDTAVPIGGGRFKMSPESFLSKCKNKKDVQEKTQFFKDYICGELPPLWESFFDSIKKRCNPFYSENRQFYLLKLDASDKKLASLLSTDETLKKIIVKAEGYRILVSKEDYPAFEQRLKQYGYLV